MALNVSKPGDSINNKPKLTKFGRNLIIAAIAVVVVIIIAVVASAANHKAQEAKAAPVNLAIQRALSVCDSNVGTVKAPADVLIPYEMLKSEIAKEKDIEKKVNLTDQVLALALQMATGNQSAIDEINGSRNRIYVAFKAYQEG